MGITNQHAQARDEADERKALIKALVIISLICVFSFIGYLSGLRRHVDEIQNWFKSLGYWSPIIFFLIYVATTVVAIPRGVLTVMAGSIFGSLYGVIIVSISASLGAVLSFLVSRYILRKNVAPLFSNNEKFQLLNRLTEKHGGIIVAFTRLNPIFPFNFLNYGFGLTKIDIGTYILWSWICMLPWTILYVLGGDAILESIREGRPPLLLLAAIAVSAIIILVISNHIRKILKQKEWKSDGVRESTSG
jgi:uncharacterized membrane protein YdjX (TVP38/TMEM64 family)